MILLSSDMACLLVPLVTGLSCVRMLTGVHVLYHNILPKYQYCDLFVHLFRNAIFIPSSGNHFSLNLFSPSYTYTHAHMHACTHASVHTCMHTQPCVYPHPHSLTPNTHTYSHSPLSPPSYTHTYLSLFLHSREESYS